MPQYIVIKFR